MIFCTSGWRTTSALVKRVKAMPRTPASMRAGLDQAALLPAREVDLRDVAGDHRLGAEADAGQEHLHLLGRRVLRLVEDDERVVERAAAHVRQRRDLDRPALEELADLVEAHHVVQRVVERAQVRVDLLLEIAGQEAEPLAGLDRRAHEHDALDRVALERVDGAGDGEVGLAGARRTDAERDVVLVMSLRYSIWLGVRPCRSARRVRRRGAVGGVRRRGGSRPLRRISTRPSWMSSTDSGFSAAGVEALERRGGARGLHRVAGDGERSAAMRDRDVQRRLDLPQVRVERAAQVRERAVVERRERPISRRSRPSRPWRWPPRPRHGQTPCRTSGAFSASSSVPRLDEVRRASGVPVAAARGRSARTAASPPRGTARRRPPACPATDA